MNEANSNATSFNSNHDVEFVSPADNNQFESQAHSPAENNPVEYTSGLANSTRDNIVSSDDNQIGNQNGAKDSLEQEMNWQRIAHKLREYNRKLLKKVFRIEQELADSNNEFDKLTEKSCSSDLLVAQQAEKIEIYQEKISELNQQIAGELSSSQQKIDIHREALNKLSQRFELSQQQTAQLERECVLLKEESNNKAFEMDSKDKEISDLKAKLSQQQRYTMQYKAELKRQSEKATRSTRSTRPARSNREAASSKNSLKNRSIEPWSNYAASYATSEPTISLPQTRTKTKATNKRSHAPEASARVKTAAEIATWSASETPRQKSRQKDSKTPVESFKSGKPQSLAAVDLPTFPKPQ